MAGLQLKEVVGAEAVEAQEAAMPGLSRAQLDMFLKDWASARIGTGKGHDRAAGAPQSTKAPQHCGASQPLTVPIRVVYIHATITPPATWYRLPSAPRFGATIMRC